MDGILKVIVHGNTLPTQYNFMVWWLAKHRDKFNLIFPLHKITLG